MKKALDAVIKEAVDFQICPKHHYSHSYDGINMSLTCKKCGFNVVITSDMVFHLAAVKKYWDNRRKDW